MATTDLSVTPIKGKIMRLITVDACGNPTSGGSLVVVSKGFIKVQIQPQYEQGVKQRIKLADGTLCVNDDDPDELSNIQLTMDFCGVCPSISNIANGARLLTASGAGISGTGAVYSEGPVTNRFSLELWQLVTGKGACDFQGSQRYVYWAFPNVGIGTVGSMNIENVGLTMQIMCRTDAIGSNWQSVLSQISPTNVGLPWITGNNLQYGDHALWNITTTAPPALPSDCGGKTL